MPDLRVVRDLDTSEQRQYHDFEEEMLKIIEHVDEFSWNRGVLGGFSFGEELLNEAFNGLQPALYLIAGQPNIGKSALALQLAWKVAHSNRNVYVIYFALDDPDIAILPRVVAMDQRIPIDAVKIPKRYEDNRVIMNKRSIGFQRLRDAVDRFKLLDQKFGNTIEYIIQTAKAHKAKLQSHGIDKDVVIFIDNLFDVSTEAMIADEQVRLKYVIGELDHLCETQLMPVVATAELKKLNGTRRPIMDDIRETIKTQYTASAIMLCFNEVKIKGERADVYHEVAGVEGKQPVLEVHIAKNKLGSECGRLFYNMYPGYSFLEPVSKEGARYYLSRLSG